MRLVYQAPDGETFLFDPSAEQMASILRESGDDYWLSGGNGEAQIDACLSPGEDGPSHARLIRPDGLTIVFAADRPSLWIKRPEAGRFFFTWDGPQGWYVPYDGGSCEPYVMDERGGDPFKIPRACLVDLDSAIRIASHFLASLERSPTVTWALWNDLPLPEDWYD